MQKKIQAFENKSHSKLLGIKYQERKKNAFFHNKMIELISNYEPLLQTIKPCKLEWFGHDNLCKTIMQGAVEGSRNRGRLKQKWIDNIIKWTHNDVNCLIKDVHERYHWSNCVTLASLIPLRFTSHGITSK